MDPQIHACEEPGVENHEIIKESLGEWITERIKQNPQKLLINYYPIEGRAYPLFRFKKEFELLEKVNSSNSGSDKDIVMGNENDVKQKKKDND